MDNFNQRQQKKLKFTCEIQENPHLCSIWTSDQGIFLTNDTIM